MRHSYSLKNFAFVVLALNLLFVLNLNVFSQCEGIYFNSTTAKTIFPLPYTTYAAYDLNGDGKLDLLGANSINPGLTNKIYVAPGNGDGTFGLPAEIVLPAIIGMDKTLVKDFNSDGKNDILVRTFSNPAIIIIYQNNDNRSFTQLTSTAIPDAEQIKDFVDINNDGFADLLTRSLSTGYLNYRFANTDGTFNSPVQIAEENYTITGDFNNDGRIDIAATKLYSQPDTLRIYYNQGDGVFTVYNTSLDLDFAHELFVTSDLNHDGRLDLITRTVDQAPNQNPQYPKRFTVILNLGKNNFSKTEYELPSRDYLASGDFDGDGFTDMFYFSSYLRSYSVFKNDGTGNFQRRTYNFTLPIYGYGWFLPGDFDGDKKTDFLKYAFTGSRIFPEASAGLLKNECGKRGQTKIVDFFNSYQSHYTLWRESDGRWRSLIPSELKTGLIEFNWGKAGDIPTPGDYDGDGMTDFAVYRPSEGIWYIRNSSDSTYTTLPFGLNEDKPVAADYNGDGKTDIAVFRPADGYWYIQYSGTQQHYIAHFGLFKDKPVPEDYDGDGKTDLAVFRPSSGTWYYLRSSDGNFVATRFGSRLDTPLPGDYDGDGKADLCFFRASLADWHILRSYNSDILIYRWGASGDIPQTGDWDGDGITDIGVYRPSTRMWYPQRGSYGYLYGETGEVPVGSTFRVQ